VRSSRACCSSTSCSRTPARVVGEIERADRRERPSVSRSRRGRADEPHELGRDVAHGRQRGFRGRGRPG
jgi:hypothetical protein